MSHDIVRQFRDRAWGENLPAGNETLNENPAKHPITD